MTLFSCKKCITTKVFKNIFYNTIKFGKMKTKLKKNYLKNEDEAQEKM
jgi:hypothetical protein